MRDVSDRWLDTARTGGRLLAELTCHPPQGDPVVLELGDMSVEQESGTGQRFSASAEVVPQVGQDTWQVVSWPGSWFELRVGWRYGPTTTEWISYGEYVHDDAPTYDLTKTISLNLGDRWSDLDRVKYDSKYTPKEDDRTKIVQNEVRSGLRKDQPIRIDETVDGGEFELPDGDGEGTQKPEWDERTKLVEDMAKDGGFEAWFDADGVFRITDPDKLASRSVASFTDGKDANIIELSRGGRFVEFYNRASLSPERTDGDNKQDWGTVTATLDEPGNPLDPSNMRGMRIVKAETSKTITSQRIAKQRVRKLLRSALRQEAERELQSYNLAHIEPGDTVTVVTAATQTEGRISGRWLVTKTSYSPLTGESSLTLSSTRKIVVSEDTAKRVPSASTFPTAGLTPLTAGDK